VGEEASFWGHKKWKYNKQKMKEETDKEKIQERQTEKVAQGCNERNV